MTQFENVLNTFKGFLKERMFGDNDFTNEDMIEVIDFFELQFYYNQEDEKTLIAYGHINAPVGYDNYDLANDLR